MFIRLCLLIPMPMVTPTLTCDLTKLELEFTHNYRDGASMFCISTTNEKGDMELMTLEEIASFSPLWKEKVVKFEEFLDRTPELKQLKNLKFFICDGNYQHIA